MESRKAYNLILAARLGWQYDISAERLPLRKWKTPQGAKRINGPFDTIVDFLRGLSGLSDLSDEEIYELAKYFIRYHLGIIP